MRTSANRGPCAIRWAGIVLVASAVAGAAFAHDHDLDSAAATPELTLTEVSPAVVMASHSHGANMTCIALESGLVFVDAGLSTNLAAEFRTGMEARFERPTRALIVTHAHLDHFIGMGAFSDLSVIAAGTSRPLFEHQLGIEWNERAIGFYSSIFPTFADDIADASPFVPTVWFDHDTAIGDRDERVVVVNSGGHTAGSSFVYFPAEAVVVAGDLVQARRRPYFGDPSTDLSVWIETLKSWQALGAKRICPGHGPVVEGSELTPIWRYFEALRATLKQLKEDGVTLEDAVSHPSLPGGYWPDGDGEPPWWTGSLAVAWHGL